MDTETTQLSIKVQFRLQSPGLITVNPNHLVYSDNNKALYIAEHPAPLLLAQLADKPIQIQLHPERSLVAAITESSLYVWDLSNHEKLIENSGKWHDMRWLDTEDSLVLISNTEAEIQGVLNPHSLKNAFTDEIRSLETDVISGRVAFTFDEYVIVTDSTLNNELFKYGCNALGVHFRSANEIVLIDTHTIKLISLEHHGIIHTTIPIDFPTDYSVFSQQSQTCTLISGQGQLLVIRENQDRIEQSVEGNIGSCALKVASDEVLYLRTEKEILAVEFNSPPSSIQFEMPEQWTNQTGKLGGSPQNQVTQNLQDLQRRLENILVEGPLIDNISENIKNSIEQRTVFDQIQLKKILPQLITQTLREEFQSQIIPTFEKTIKEMMEQLYLNFETSMRDMVDRGVKEEVKYNSLNTHLKGVVENMQQLAGKVQKVVYKLNNIDTNQQANLASLAVNSQENSPVNDSNSALKAELDTLLQNKEYNSAIERVFDDTEYLFAVLRVMNPRPLSKVLSPNLQGALILRLLSSEGFTQRYDWILELSKHCPVKGPVAKQVFSALEAVTGNDPRLRKSFDLFKDRLLDS